MLIFPRPRRPWPIDVWITLAWWLCIIYAAATFRLLWVNFSLNHVYHFNVLIFVEKQAADRQTTILAAACQCQWLVTFQFRRCVIFDQTIFQNKLPPEPLGIYQQLRRRHLSSPFRVRGAYHVFLLRITLDGIINQQITTNKYLNIFIEVYSNYQARFHFYL